LVALRDVSVGGLKYVNGDSQYPAELIYLTPSIALLEEDLEASPLMANLAGVSALPGYI
jgi:hypothetical protein